MSYKAILNIPGNSYLQNLRQQLIEIDPYQKNLVQSVRNLKQGLFGELANIQISLNAAPYVFKGLAYDQGLCYFRRFGALKTTLAHLEASDDYMAAVAVIEPLEEAIRIAEEEEVAIQDRMNQANAALRDAEAAAVAKAKQSPEVVNAQKALAAVEALKK